MVRRMIICGFILNNFEGKLGGKERWGIDKFLNEYSVVFRKINVSRI